MTTCHYDYDYDDDDSVVICLYETWLQTLLYIAVGVVTSVAVPIAMAFSLLVLVPALSQLTAGIDHSLDTRVLGAVSFSKYDANDTYVYVLHDVHTTCVYVLRTAAVISGPRLACGIFIPSRHAANHG